MTMFECDKHAWINKLNFFIPNLIVFQFVFFEDAKAEGGRLVKEADFEAEKKIPTKKNLAFQICFYVLWHFSH